VIRAHSQAWIATNCKLPDHSRTHGLAYGQQNRLAVRIEDLSIDFPINVWVVVLDRMRTELRKVFKADQTQGSVPVEATAMPTWVEAVYQSIRVELP